MKSCMKVFLYNLLKAYAVRFRGGPSCLLFFFSYRNHISVKIMKSPPLKIVTYSGLGVFKFLVNVTFYASVTIEIEIIGY